MGRVYGENKSPSEWPGGTASCLDHLLPQPAEGGHNLHSQGAETAPDKTPHVTVFQRNTHILDFVCVCVCVGGVTLKKSHRNKMDEIILGPGLALRRAGRGERAAPGWHSIRVSAPNVVRMTGTKKAHHHYITQD